MIDEGKKQAAKLARQFEGYGADVKGAGLAGSQLMV
jgi:hypothetical protein